MHTVVGYTEGVGAGGPLREGDRDGHLDGSGTGKLVLHEAPEQAGCVLMTKPLEIANQIAQMTADAEYCDEMRSTSNNPEYWAESSYAIREQIAELEMSA